MHAPFRFLPSLMSNAQHRGGSGRTPATTDPQSVSPLDVVQQLVTHITNTTAGTSVPTSCVRPSRGFKERGLTKECVKCTCLFPSVTDTLILYVYHISNDVYTRGRCSRFGAPHVGPPSFLHASFARPIPAKGYVRLPVTESSREATVRTAAIQSYLEIVLVYREREAIVAATRTRRTAQRKTQSSPFTWVATTMAYTICGASLGHSHHRPSSLKRANRVSHGRPAAEGGSTYCGATDTSTDEPPKVAAASTSQQSLTH